MISQHDLGAAEHVAGRREPYRNTTYNDAFAVAERLH